LEEQGFITREPDPADGRYTNAVLTEAGMTAVVAAAPGHVTAVRSLVFDALSTGQMQELRDANDRILAKVDPGGRSLGR
jgi:DNA-binding MarR family transcriptional regulator